MSEAIAEKNKTLFHISSIADIHIIYDIWINQEVFTFFKNACCSVAVWGGGVFMNRHTCDSNVCSFIVFRTAENNYPQYQFPFWSLRSKLRAMVLLRIISEQ